MDPGTQIVFQAIDSNNINVTTYPVTVQVRRGVFPYVPPVVTGVLNCSFLLFATLSFSRMQGWLANLKLLYS
jgi:hypothetical protein